MSDLLIPGTPDNLRLPPHLRGVKTVEGDLYNVCNRIKEIDPNLYVVLHDGQEKPFVVMENCLDGEQRMVKRYAQLDASILEDLQRMLRIPFAKRFLEEAERVDAYNEAQENAWMESEAHEKLIFDMGRALRESNIAAGRTEPVSMYRGKKK